MLQTTMLLIFITTIHALISCNSIRNDFTSAGLDHHTELTCCDRADNNGSLYDFHGTKSSLFHTVFRIEASNATNIAHVESMLSSENGIGFTSSAPGCRRLTMNTQSYGDAHWTDIVEEWDTQAEYIDYVKWRSCYGPIAGATEAPFTSCEPTCAGGTDANGSTLCRGSAPIEPYGSLLKKIFGLYATTESAAFLDRYLPSLLQGSGSVNTMRF